MSLGLDFTRSSGNLLPRSSSRFAGRSSSNYDNTISVIDEKADKVVAGAIFNVKPINAGRIECNKNNSSIPVDQQFYLWSGSECVAKPNHGFEFVSWQENLKGNSTRLIKVVSPPYFFDPVLDFLHIIPDKPESTINITKFGSFTANFKLLPPAIPAEYWATLFAVIVTAIVGSWFIPTSIGWLSSRIQRGKLNCHIQTVKDLDNKRELDKNDIVDLNKLGNNIAVEYSRGKLTKDQYEILGNEISINYNKFFSKKIDSLRSFYEMDKVKQLVEINNSIEDIHTTGKLSDQHYTNLKNEVSKLREEIFRERMKSLDKLTKDDKVKQVNLVDEIKDEISDARSKGMINELHYSMLNEKLANYEKSKM